MPKQKRYDFKRLQGSSTSKSDAKADDSNRSTSVNDRLSELRRADSALATQIKRELEANVNQPTVPPALRSILGVPESAPPPARPGVRIRERLRTPGPAPPTSWLRGDRTGVAGETAIRRARQSVVERKRPEEPFRFAQLARIDDQDTSSLSHSCLKQLATNWNLLDENHYHSLLVLPPQIRLRLISYLNYYGPAISIQAFRALVAENEAITMLDLAGLVGNDTLTLPKLTREIKDARLVTNGTANATIAETWEEDEPQLNLLSIRGSTNFSKLSHLCLSHPPSNVRWQDLLNLTKQTPGLTHLSLAYWPRPTLTPNLTTTTVTNQHGPDIAAGASDFYSHFDQDFEEPKAILRQLSHNLLRLQWLDIEGRPEWLQALAPVKDEQPARSAQNMRRHGEAWEATTTGSTDASVKLVTTWKNLAYVRCARQYITATPWPVQQQGKDVWLPPSNSISMVQRDLLLQSTDLQNADPEMRQRHVEWWREEMAILRIAHSINAFRKVNKCAPIAVDLGWNYR